MAVRCGCFFFVLFFIREARRIVVALVFTANAQKLGTEAAQALQLPRTWQVYIYVAVHEKA